MSSQKQILSKFVLCRVGGQTTDKDIPLSIGQVLVGRDKKADISLKSQFMSRAHCTFHVSMDSVVMEDTSTGGTYINNEKILKKSCPIKVNDIIGFGVVTVLTDEEIQKYNKHLYIYKLVEKNDEFSAPLQPKRTRRMTHQEASGLKSSEKLPKSKKITVLEDILVQPIIKPTQNNTVPKLAFVRKAQASVDKKKNEATHAEEDDDILLEQRLARMREMRNECLSPKSLKVKERIYKNSSATKRKLSEEIECSTTASSAPKTPKAKKVQFDADKNKVFTYEEN